MNPFSTLNLNHKRTRDRIRACLAAIDGQDVFDRKDLDQICGQGNKPLGQLLRRNCFIRRPEVVGMKNGETYLYVPFELGVSDLRAVLMAYDTTHSE